jgi:ATP-dependent metalloprotease FtsH
MEELRKVYSRIQRKYRALTTEQKTKLKTSGTVAAVLLFMLLINRLRNRPKMLKIRTVAMSELLRRLRSTDKVEFRASGLVLVPTLGLASFLIPGGEQMITKLIIARVRDFQFVPEQVSVANTMFRVFFPVALIFGWFHAVKSLIHPQDEGTIDASKRSSLIPKTTFADVVFTEKRELVEVVDFLNDPGRFRSAGARLPRGVLLNGPSGSGKTLLARSVAGEANCSFLSVAGSEFVDTYVGKGAARVRSLFNQARALAPCVVFIDELDALGKRDVGFGTIADSGHSEYIHTLNQLLTELDGISGNQSDEIVVIAATNRFDAIDAALLRPGRFDRHVWVKLPDTTARLEILKLHSKGLEMTKEATNALKVIAEKTDGCSGADLANLVNESVFFAIRRGQTRSVVTPQDLNEALNKTKLLKAGPSGLGMANTRSVLELN